ncbi:MAG: hypothetical protein LDL27_03480 [Desulfovibrio sp.]|nr:hypothetical protein [Desulfovibrio sp.]
MKIIATCGHEWSGYEQVHAALAAAGVAPALPGGQDNRTIAQLHELLPQAHNHAAAPVSPGSSWQQQAAALFQANQHQDPWGWCDTRTLWLVDFWAQFDANLHVVLVFSTPEATITRLLEAGSSSPQAVNACLDSWVAYNDELLRCYHRHTPRCLLVEASAGTIAPTPLQELLNRRFGMTLQPAPVRPEPVRPEPPSPLARVVSHIMRGLLDQRQDLLSLHHELRASADTAGPKSGEETSALQALALLPSLGASEKQLLLTQLAQVQENAEQYFLEYQRVINEKHAVDSQLERLRALWLRCQPLEVCIDLREPFDGSNWFDAEDDGSWAGPEQRSSIFLPALRPGQYLLQLDIVDAMDPAIVSGLQCELNGVPLPVAAPTPCPSGQSGQSVVLSILLDTQHIPARPIWELQLVFPHLVSPAEAGTSEDPRSLAIRVQSVRFLSLADAGPNPVASGTCACSR